MLRKHAEELGEALTSDVLAKLLAAIRTKANNALHYFMKEYPDHDISMEYNNALDNEARRDALCRYAIDAGQGKLSITQSTSVVNSQVRNANSGWKHESEVAGLVHCKDLAKMICTDLARNPDLVRDSEYPTARAAGLKQYWYTARAYDSSLAVHQSATVEGRVDNLAPDAYVWVRDDMLSLGDGLINGEVNNKRAADGAPSSSGAKHRRLPDGPVPSPIADETDEARAAKKFEAECNEITTRFTDHKLSCEKMHDRIAKELGQSSKVISRIRPKPCWGDTCATHIQTETDAQTVQNLNLFERFVWRLHRFRTSINALATQNGHMTNGLPR